MRRRTGRFVGYKVFDDVDGEPVGYEVDILVSAAPGVNNQDERTRYIRDNCRRGDWSKVPWVLQYHMPVEDGRHATVRYLFADKEDAAIFRMRFG